MRMLDFFADDMEAATLNQFAGGSLDSEGVWVPGSVTPVSISVIELQPLDAEMMDVVREGDDIRDYRWTVVSSDEPVSIRAGDNDADQIVVGADTYQVMQKDTYDPQGHTIEVVLRAV